jgi:Tol biopolymer transport system component
MPLLQGKHSEEQPALSPDGRWLAYTSNESGIQRVYLTRFPSGQGKWQASTEDDGAFPAWSPDGARLYFVGPELSIFEVQLETDPHVVLTPPRLVLDGGKLGVDPYLGFDFTTDGKGLIFIKSSNAGDKQALGVIENWFAEFKDRP